MKPTPQNKQKMFLSRQRGAILALVVLALISLLLTVGLVIDSAILFLERRLAANATDVAALAAAKAVYNEQDEGEDLAINPLRCSDRVVGERAAVDVACDQTAILGYADEVVEVAIPPVSGTLADIPVPDPYVRIQVRMNPEYHTFLMGLGGIFSTTVHGSAVSEVVRGGPPPFSMLLLNDKECDETDKYAFEVNNNDDARIDTGIYVNSQCFPSGKVNANDAFCAKSLNLYVNPDLHPTPPLLSEVFEENGEKIAFGDCDEVMGSSEGSPNITEQCYPDPLRDKITTLFEEHVPDSSAPPLRNANY